MKEVFSRSVEIEEKKSRIDLNILKKKSKANTFSGYLIGLMKKAREDENFEITFFLQEIYKKYMEFQKTSNIMLKSWKGKSGIRVIRAPDRFIITTFQKKDQDSLPSEKKLEVTKEEVNRVIYFINQLKKNEIKTREIAELVYKENWKEVFSNRSEHIKLNLILRLLDYLELIKYRAGIIKILNDKTEIQVIL